jgi:tetratricopeptide (TPR) repeat protein
MRKHLGRHWRSAAFGFLGMLLCAHPLLAQHNAEQQMFVVIEGLGDHHHEITTAAPQSQRFFDQGLRLIYAFNHSEAIRAFRAIEDVDPRCAMAQWGIAYALGPNYNLPAEPERDKEAFAALEKAQRYAKQATPAEQDYIAALAKRYSPTPETADREELNRAYADAMRELSKKYPDDMDAATLYAEALMDLRPWELWTHDAKPQPGTEEIVAALEHVLEKSPNHPGANHFYIHAIEASPYPERGLPSAERLPGLMPAAGHMVHMPAHIYLRLGRYADAAENNRRAVAADRAYIAKCKPEGVYPMMYYPHNIHFLWSSLCVSGRRAEALAAADDLAVLVTDDLVRQMPVIEGFVPTRLFTLVRFGMWDDVLQLPEPAADFLYARAMRHYARGLALIEKKQLDAAQKELQQLEEVQATIPPDRLAGRDRHGYRGGQASRGTRQGGRRRRATHRGRRRAGRSAI